MICKIRKWLLSDAEDLTVAISNKKVQDNLRDGIPYPYTVQDGINFISAMLSADENVDLSEYADVKLSRQGNSCTITIFPKEKNIKSKRRMMYTSCIVIVDLKAAELRSVRIYERGENYTQYDFSNYIINAEIDTNAFDVQAMM